MNWRDHDLVVVSVFAGVGGLDLGFEQAGVPTAVQIEVDPSCQRVLEARFPDAVRFGDVTKVEVSDVRRVVGGRRVVLVGGFPCQDLSVAGRRGGMAGERSGLYGELVRLADGLDPDWFVIENVPGLLSADIDPDANDGGGWGTGTAMALLLGDVTGYRPAVPDGGWRSSGMCVGAKRSACWRVLDARYFGVAQRRRRVFVVACPRDRVAPAAVLLEPEGVRGDPPPGGPPRPRFAEGPARAAVRAGGPGADGGGEGGARALTADEGVVSALTGGLGSGGAVAEHAHAGWMVPTGDGGLPMSARVNTDDVAATLTTSDSPNRGGTAGPMQLVPPVARDVAPALTSSYGKQPDSSDTNLGPYDDPNDRVTHALTSEGADASEDGTGRGTPLAVGTWRKSRRAQTDQDDETWVPDEVANTLNTFDGGDTRATELVVDGFAFAEGTTGQAVGDVAPTLPASQPSDSSNRQVAVVAPGRHTHTTEGHSPTVTASKEGPPAVYAPDEAATLTSGSHAEEVNPPGRGSEDDVNLVASFTDNGSEVYETVEQTGALCSGGGIPGQGYQAVRAAAQVRRLTPVECFPPDTPLLGSGGTIGDARVGDPVLTDVEGLGVVKDVMRRPYDGLLVVVRAQGLLPLRATPEHPVLAYPGSKTKGRSGRVQLGEPRWVRVGDLEPWRDGRGDFLAIPRLRGIYDDATIDLAPYVERGRNHAQLRRTRGLPQHYPLNRGGAWLLGLYVAEGCARVTDRQSRVEITPGWDEALAGYAQALLRKFGFAASLHRKRTSLHVCASSAPLARMLLDQCGAGAHDKRIPDVVLLHRDPDVLLSFLRGYLIGDGWTKADGTSSGANTVAPMLAAHLQLALARIGRYAGIRYVKRAGGTIDGRQLRGDGFYAVTWQGTHHARHQVTDRHIAVPVRSVTTERYVGDVCNVETSDNTYVVGGAVVHNCERLQGFPDGWTDPHEDAADSPRYRMLGNAVCVPVAGWVGWRLLAWENGWRP